MIWTKASWPTSRWSNFSFEEFSCKHTGKNEMEEEFMDELQEIRRELGKAMVVTSGFRDKTHPVEAKKKAPGAHALGRAVDIACAGAAAFRISQIALSRGRITGIGIAQKDSSRFLHLDMVPITSMEIPRPMLWSY